MLIAVLPVTTYADCQAKILANSDLVDGFELRWDYAKDASADFIASIRALSKKPMIFTLRTQAQGGLYKASLQDYVLILQRLAQARPDYLDLDYQLPPECFQLITIHYPRIQIILSMHIYTHQNLDWTLLYQKSKSLPHAVFKLALECPSGLAALKFLKTCQSFPFQTPSSIIAMGTHACFARVLGPWRANFFDYAYLDGQTPFAPGQLTVNELLTIYRYRSLNTSTALYGLIGYPIEASIGHYFHNEAFSQAGKNAIYVKIPLQAHELAEALSLCLSLNFQGLSVTMPLKQKLSEFLASPLPSINTLKNKGHGWQAFNVDGLGAIAAYELHAKPKAKRILIIGNGGAALAIQAAFIHHGYTVEVLARSPRRAGEVASIPSLKLLPYAGIINTLPAQAYAHPHDEWIQAILKLLKPQTNVMDIVYHEKSYFQLRAEDLDCHLIPGIAMYQAQANYQQQLWFDDKEKSKLNLLT